MSRKLSLVLAVCLIIFVTMSFKAEAADYRISPYIGMICSQLAYDGDDLLEDYYDSWSVENPYRFGYTAGVIFSLKTRKESRISLESGISYQLRGGKTELVLIDESGELTTRENLEQDSHYLSFPIHVKLQCLRNNLKPYLKFGAEFGFCAHASTIAKGSITNSSGATVYAKPIERDVTDSIKNPDIELFVGVGFDMPIGSRSGFVQLSYSHGLTDVNDPEDSLWDVKQHYKNISLIFGYNFDI